MIDKELQEQLTRLLGVRTPVFAGTVKLVDKKKGVCIVDDGEIAHQVRLTAVVDENSHRFWIYPAVGSSVLLGAIYDDMNRLFIVEYGEVEGVDLKIDNTQLKVSKDGFLLKKQNETLKKLVSDLIGAIKRMKFATNGSATIELLNRVEFEAIENRFNRFLKDS